MRNRVCIAALVLFAWAHSALAAIDVGQASAGAFTGGATSVTTTGITTSASGSSFIIYVSYVSGFSVSSIADSKSNSYTLVASALTGWLSATNSAIYLCTNCTGGSGHTATLNLSGSTQAEIYLVEVTGGATASLVDATPSTFWNDDTASPFTSNSLTSSNANDLLLAFTNTNGNTTDTFTWGNSFTQVTADGNPAHFTGGVAKRVVSSTGTYNSTFTSSGGTSEAASALISLKASGGGGGGCTHNFWKSTGAFVQPDGTTGSYWNLATGAFSTPNCSTGTFWRQDGASAAN